MGYLSGTSLYCFTVALSENGSGKKIVELEIIKKAQEKYTHVFACDHWTVFSDKEMALNPGKTVKVDYPKTVKRPNTKNWVNLPLFLNVWKIIKQATTWKSFHGSLEVISRQAFGTFLDHLEDCQRVLPWSNADHAHFKYYGEDKFAAWCMHAYGVDKVPSMQSVESVPGGQPIYGLHVSVSCPGHRSLIDLNSTKWHPNCSRTKTAGMFAFRTVEKYLTCLQETTER